MRDLPGSSGLRRTIVGAVTGALLISGCSEKQKANDSLPSSSASPTTEARPEVGPADFPVPDEARTGDAAGAEAFLRYFLELINRQRAVPGGQPLRELGPECRECQRIAQVYDEAADAGRQFEGGDFAVESLGPPVVENGEAVINFFAGQEAIALVDSAGAVVESLPTGSHLGSGMRLRWSEETSSWVITGLTIG